MLSAQKPSSSSSAMRVQALKIASRWRKAKGYTTTLALAVLDLLLLLFCLVRALLVCCGAVLVIIACFCNENHWK
jgi:hypothetical protein